MNLLPTPVTFGVVALDRCRVGTALVDGYLVWLAMQFHGPFQKSPRRNGETLSFDMIKYATP
jgi:hypothetical protein